MSEDVVRPVMADADKRESAQDAENYAAYLETLGDLSLDETAEALRDAAQAIRDAEKRGRIAGLMEARQEILNIWRQRSNTAQPNSKRDTDVMTWTDIRERLEAGEHGRKLDNAIGCAWLRWRRRV
jgi:exonuclease VII small subunit